jgi:hypothetical protein
MQITNYTNYPVGDFYGTVALNAREDSSENENAASDEMYAAADQTAEYPVQQCDYHFPFISMALEKPGAAGSSRVEDASDRGSGSSSAIAPSSTGRSIGSEIPPEGAEAAALTKRNNRLPARRWVSEEDRILLEVMKNQLPWAAVEKLYNKNIPPCLRKRTIKQLRTRWALHIRPGINNEPLAEAEQKRIVLLYNQNKNEKHVWASIAAEIGNGRTCRQVQNYIKSTHQFI